MKVRAATESDFVWFRQRNTSGLTPGARGIVAADSHDAPHGMAVYDRWTPCACEMHIVLATPAAYRPLLSAAFEYPFLQLGLMLVFGIIPSDNTRSLRLATRLGFEVTHRTRDGWKQGVDLIHLEMRRDACRWLRPMEVAA